MTPEQPVYVPKASFRQSQCFWFSLTKDFIILFTWFDVDYLLIALTQLFAVPSVKGKLRGLTIKSLSQEESVMHLWPYLALMLGVLQFF